MSTQQFQGKTVEEATKLALEELKVNLEEVKVEVISPGKSGILGLGGEPALIEVTIEDDEGKSSKSQSIQKLSNKKTSPVREMDDVDEDTEKLAVDLVNYILSSLEVDVKTFFRDQDDFDNKSVYFEIEGDDSGLIIGRKGETLRSLEFLISFIIKRQLDKKVRVILDVEGYQERRRQNITSLAESAAEKVIKSGKPVKMDPMSPFDRRIVHLALEKESKITTESQGSGSRRQVVIKLK
ncbi:MAG: hypothetical protein CL762_02740 [Chloroflexi bacterium]|nr:hypothetical protein [Chloroflexota bacterium]|tara:strand:+ start:17596 stop:18312 length:717 start_codon:yes stop_codon:yes gene_type:complete